MRAVQKREPLGPRGKVPKGEDWRGVRDQAHPLSSGVFFEEIHGFKSNPEELPGGGEGPKGKVKRGPTSTFMCCQTVLRNLCEKGSFQKEGNQGGEWRMERARAITLRLLSSVPSERGGGDHKKGNKGWGEENRGESSFFV